MSTTTQPSSAELLAALRSNADMPRVLEERESLRLSYMDFVEASWHTIKPHEPFLRNWHLEALAYHQEAVSRGEIDRLQVWVPPGAMKSGMVNIFWHPWEWTTRPWLRYFTASYEQHLSGRFSLNSQLIIRHPWFQARWGDMFDLVLDAAGYWTNNQGGSRFATTPKSSGTGEHGHRILIDDPVRAGAAEEGATTDLRAELAEAQTWYDGTVSSRFIDTPDMKHARIIIMQRLHQNDLAAHTLDQEEWTILALPERFWKGHPYAWRGTNVHQAVRPHLPPLLATGDPREEGELLWPARRDERASDALAKQLTTLRAPGQLQQWPVAREGNLLKREWWRFYDPRIRDREQWDRLPKFGMIVISVDTPLKDKETNDYVAIQCYGVAHGKADRYLLDLRKARLNYGAAKRTVKEMALWAQRTWKRTPCFTLIENAGYGVELYDDLRHEVTGVKKIVPGAEGDKVARAEAASDALESGNIFVPGHGPPWRPEYDEARTSDDIADFIASCAAFPHGAHDDDVDAWSQAQNFLRGRRTTYARGSSILRSRLR